VIPTSDPETRFETEKICGVYRQAYWRIYFRWCITHGVVQYRRGTDGSRKPTSLHTTFVAAAVCLNAGSEIHDAL
jgi:hypothetical protein